MNEQIQSPTERLKPEGQTDSENGARRGAVQSGARTRAEKVSGAKPTERLKLNRQTSSENAARRGAVHNGVELTPLKPQIRAEEPKATERLVGSIERVTFHSEESGFCVLRVKVRGHHDLITITGTAASVAPGEYIDCDGQFINDRQYGLQFKAQRLSIVPPGTLDGIEKYLASGMIKGIGPHFAKKLIKAFGEEVFTVIEQEPNKLRALPGIGQIRMQRVAAGWAEQKAIREIMIFLQSYGVGPSRAVRIYKTYGNEAIAKVSENPYQLALDIYGIGFKTADTIAGKLGIPSDSPMRAQAGVRHALQELSNQGHCACVYEDLAQMSAKLLAIPEALTLAAIEHEIAAGNLVMEEIESKRLVYLKSLNQAEIGVASHLKRLNTGTSPWSAMELDQALSILDQQCEIELSHSQQNALQLALRHKVLGDHRRTWCRENHIG